jgi:hypothetical protein
VAEDPEDAREQRHDGAVEELRALGHHPPDERLRRREPDGAPLIGRRVGADAM